MKQAVKKIFGLSFLLPAGLTCLSIFYLWGCRKLSFGSLANPEEGFIPIVFGVFFLGCSLTLLYSETRNSQRRSAFLTPQEIKMAGQMAVLLVAFALLLPITGFSGGSFLLIVFAGRIMRAKISTSLLTGAGTVLTIYFLLQVWLKIPLPKSMIF